MLKPLGEWVTGNKHRAWFYEEENKKKKKKQKLTKFSYYFES